MLANAGVGVNETASEHQQAVWSAVRFIYGRLALPGIVVLALFLRLHQLDLHSLWYDEVASVETAQRGVAAIFTDRFGWMHIQTSFHYLLIWFGTLFGDPTTTSAFVRLPSVVAGTLTPLALYGLGKEIFGRAQGMLAAFLLALSMVHSDYSQDARPYAVLTLLTAVAVYCLLVARRTNSGRWWAAFTLALVADLLNAYHTITLVIPTLALYALWVLWSLRQNKSQGGDRSANRRGLLFATISFSMIAVVFLVLALDMLQVPRTSPDIGRFMGEATTAPFLMVEEVITWFTQFGLDKPFSVIVQAACLLLAAWGFIVAILRSQKNAAFLCWLFLFVPPALLAFFSTTNPVFERYALFSMLFYLLLVCNGIISLFDNGYRKFVEGFARVARRTLGAVSLALVLAAFVFGAYYFSTPNGHITFSYRPDYRAAARYISEKARPGDMVVFIDTPGGFGLAVAGYYWKNNPPIAAYDARDPRLFQVKPSGSIYWVFSHLDEALLNDLAVSRAGLNDSVAFEKVVVLRQDHPDADMATNLDKLVDKLSALRPGYASVRLLRASVYQAHGQIDQAVSIYKEPTEQSSTLIAEEYLTTAEGFEKRGDQSRAWRDAVIAKYMGPGSPAIHTWLAQALLRAGDAAGSKVENQIATALQGARP